MNSLRIYTCPLCKRSFQVGGEVMEMNSILSSLEEWPPCPTELCNGRLKATKFPPKDTELVEIPVQGFFRAVNGMGPPLGAPAESKRFVELLKTKKIVEVHMTPVGQPERVILHRLVLEDGTRLHFDSSGRGACCFYIEGPGPSCTEVVSDQLDSEAASESSSADREEAGRDSETPDPDNVDGVDSAGSSAVHPGGASELPGAGVSPMQAAGRVPTDNGG